MKRGTLHHFRRRRILRILLALGSLLFLVMSLSARAETACGPDEGCAESQPIDREFVTGLVGPPEGRPLEGQELAEKTHELALLLRCPTCQGSSVADSPSSTALNMKQEVEDLLRAGYSADQIFSYFEAAYGQFVLLQPKAEGLNLLVWIGPGILLLLGAGILVVYLRRRPEDEPEPTPARPLGPSRTALPDDEELAAWVRKVRELAYGWPGGEPPKEAS
jgi:cytochrome c-type biogenesis protein CcmH